MSRTVVRLLAALYLNTDVPLTPLPPSAWSSPVRWAADHIGGGTCVAAPTIDDHGGGHGCLP
ncbi:MAG TPA: hypothetical protein VNL71_21375, partial [Chloroflexota bacterium]|nr:hypothetical protein [Chloroflexota bacterium]